MYFCNDGNNDDADVSVYLDDEGLNDGVDDADTTKHTRWRNDGDDEGNKTASYSMMFLYNEWPADDDEYDEMSIDFAVSSYAHFNL